MIRRLFPLGACMAVRVTACVGGLLLATLVGVEAGDADPHTPDELAVINYINDFREDPAYHGRLLLLGGNVVLPGAPLFSMDVALAEITAMSAAPALIPEAVLRAAALGHGEYLAFHNAVGHFQQKGTKKFTGHDPSARLRAVGFQGPIAENVAGRAFSNWSAYQCMVIDWAGGSPDGLLPGRGHRITRQEPRWQRLGLALYERKDFGAVQVENYTTGLKGKRLIGGVVYEDRNDNGRYDPSEGVRDATVALGPHTISTGIGGQFGVALDTSWRGKIQLNGQLVAEPGQSGQPIWLPISLKPAPLPGEQVTDEERLIWLYGHDAWPAQRHLMEQLLQPDSEQAFRERRCAVLDIILLQSPEKALRELKKMRSEEAWRHDKVWLEQASAFVAILEEVEPFATSIRRGEGQRSGTMRRVKRNVERHVRRVTHADFAPAAQGVLLWFDGLQTR